RPGPMDNIPAYIRRKHGTEPVTYLHPLLEPYLEKTYGIFVYQEDIMSAAVALGGFTGPEADTLGYAIRKKKSSVLRAQKEKFVTQAAERGVEPHTIDAVFKAFEPFERYGFNKAHATCYGLIAYQTAYLKANYTVEYMTAVLTAFRSNEEKVAAAIAECRRMAIEIKLPNIHNSDVEFTVEGPAIRFGLLAVKNVGQSAIESIVAARKEGGPFKSLTDLCSRIDLRLVNRKVLEALAKVGALNDLGHPAQVLLGLDDAINAGQSATRDRLSGQTSLFDLGADETTSLERPLPFATEVPVRERLRWEKELLGLYLSEHPMGEVAEQVGQFVTAYSSDLKDESLDGQRVVIGGIVTGFRRVVTKANAMMGVATLEDLQGTIEVVVFPKMYEQTAATWTEGTILLVAGRIDHRGDDVSLLADLAVDWDSAQARGAEAFGREVAAGAGRGGRRGSPNPGQNGGVNGGGGWSSGGVNGTGTSGGRGSGRPDAERLPATPPAGAVAGPSIDRSPVAVGPGREPNADEVRPGVPRVSPLRPDAQRAGLAADAALTADRADALPEIAPAEPIPTYDEPAGFAAAGRPGVESDDEPALPDEARARAAQASAAPTSQIESRPDQILHVRFGAASSDRLVLAMEAFKVLLRERPGGTRVVLHVPGPTGAGSLPMELSRRVAYDAELLSEVRRRLGEGLVDLRLA
ncbi:MAG: polymerase subunit alpha, partial [Chloroflexota bacterium]|nr:polymerase subunit alpha [Chloroflexota bacterium]